MVCVVRYDVLASLAVFSLHKWREDDEQFGEAEIALLSSHFSIPLLKQGLDHTLCVLEWRDLKLSVRDYTRRTKQWIFSSLWKKVLDSSFDTEDLKNILALVQIMLVLPTDTASLRDSCLFQRLDGRKAFKHTCQ